MKDLTGTPPPPPPPHPPPKPSSAFLLQLSDRNQVSFKLFSAMFFTFSLVILLLKMALKHSVEVLSGVPERKKVVIYLMENVCVCFSFIQARVT